MFTGMTWMRVQALRGHKNNFRDGVCGDKKNCNDAATHGWIAAKLMIRFATVV